MVPVKTITWARVAKSAQALAAHCLLLCFTILLVMKLGLQLQRSWWFTFLPLWIFHIVVARGRFSLPAPSPPHDRHWAPCHAVVATPLLIAFELLLCTYLDSHDVYVSPVVNLKIVFLPLLAFETIVLIDNFRMCRALMPSDEESMTDEAIWETLPWSNPSIHREHHYRGASTSSLGRNQNQMSGLQASFEEDHFQGAMCGLQNIGGHVMKVPVVAFQILLCMRLEGTPKGARHIPLPVIFIPLFLVQGVAVLFSLLRLIEKIILLLRSGNSAGWFFIMFAKGRDCCGFLHHGSRLLGWWSIDESSREEQARLLHAETSGYNTFSGFPPEVVKKMPKKELAEEEKVLCRICFEGDIAVVLLPCRHRILCRYDLYIAKFCSE